MTEVCQFFHRICTQQTINKYTLTNVKLPRSTLLYKHIKFVPIKKKGLFSSQISTNPRLEVGLYKYGAKNIVCIRTWDIICSHQFFGADNGVQGTSFIVY
jgi:hypothetical protein